MLFKQNNKPQGVGAFGEKRRMVVIRGGSVAKASGNRGILDKSGWKWIFKG